MASRQTIADVVAVLEQYFDGLYNADSKLLASVFHKDARYVNAQYGDYMNYSMSEYFKIVDSRIPPSENDQGRTDEIISIEFRRNRNGDRQSVHANVRSTLP